jgi:aminoglycoside 3-N-acetyltransferase
VAESKQTLVDRGGLLGDLARLGIPRGCGILVHCSLRRIGAITGGPATLLAALLDLLGRDGTVVVPTQTADNSLSSRAFLAATAHLDPAGVMAFVDRMAGFDPARTPSTGMGAFAEHVRRRPGAVRSAHPHVSFAGVGPAASRWLAVHDLDSPLGERSPLGAMYAAGAYVLLIGVDYRVCTALHLAEYRVTSPRPRRRHHCFVQREGRRVLLTYEAIDLHDGDFDDLGVCLDEQPFVSSGRVGAAPARAFPMRPAVDFAIRWMEITR